jgi:hypothetical protein
MSNDQSERTSYFMHVPPWALGPLELLRHADGHLVNGSDTDRRIALIGFDQVIEICIEAFIRLHPKVRGGVEIPRQEQESSLRTFHSKIEFLERYLTDKKKDLGVSYETIVWYHQLRNELYHSGNGVVPAEYVVHGAREAALRVFTAIFGDVPPNAMRQPGPGAAVDPDDAIAGISNRPERSLQARAEHWPRNQAEVVHAATGRGPKATEKPSPASREREPAAEDTMEFLSAYLELERLIRSKMPLPFERSTPRVISLKILWHKLVELDASYSRFTTRISSLIAIRDRIVHTGQPQLDANELDNATLALWEITDLLRAQPDVASTTPSQF